MAMVRFNPYREMEQFFDRFNRMFNNNEARAGYSDDTSMTFAEWTPPVDIHETNEAWFVNAELPDVKKEDVKVVVHDGVLSMTGERRQEKEEKGKKLHRIERSYGRFERSFTIPGNIDEHKIVAQFKDGMLQLQLPKLPPAAAKSNAHEVKIT